MKRTQLVTAVGGALVAASLSLATPASAHPGGIGDHSTIRSAAAQGVRPQLGATNTGLVTSDSYRSTGTRISSTTHDGLLTDGWRTPGSWGWQSPFTSPAPSNWGWATTANN